MKDLFAPFYTPSESKVSSEFMSAHFFLDANILLNLYRFPETSQKHMISIFKALEGRIWIPYTAALEFHRNRNGVVSEQLKKYEEIRSTIDKNFQKLFEDISSFNLRKRHSKIDIEDFQTNLQEEKKRFFEKLKVLENGHYSLLDGDSLGVEINECFTGRVLPFLKDPKELDQIFMDAEERYKAKMPPGFEDEKKEKGKAPDFFHYGGFRFRRKYSDYVIWTEILGYSKAKKFETVIFVSDDEKSDWREKAQIKKSNRTIPRPELVDEIRRFSGVKSFSIFSSEDLIRIGGENLNIKIPEDSITAITEVVQANSPLRHYFQKRPISFTRIFVNWLLGVFPHGKVEKYSEPFPHYFVPQNRFTSGAFAIFIKAFRSDDLEKKVSLAIRRALLLSGKRKGCRTFLVLFSPDNQACEDLRWILDRLENDLSGIEVFIGVIRGCRHSGMAEFHPQFKFPK